MNTAKPEEEHLDEQLRHIRHIEYLENEQHNKSYSKRIYEWLYGSGGMQTQELRIFSCFCGCCYATESDKGTRGCIWFLFGNKRYFCQGIC